LRFVLILLEVDLRRGRSTNDVAASLRLLVAASLRLLEVLMCFERIISQILDRWQFNPLRMFSTYGWALVLSFALAGAGALADSPLKLDQNPGVQPLSSTGSIRTDGTKILSTTVPSSELGTLPSDSGFALPSVAPPTVTVGVIRNIPIADPNKCHGLPGLVSEPCMRPICGPQNCGSANLSGVTRPTQIFRPDGAESEISSLFLVDRSVCLAQLEQLEEAGEIPAEFNTPSWISKPMNSLGVNIEMPPGDLPESHTDHQHDGPCDPQQCGRGWSSFYYYFAATGLYYNPLYFEEVNLERFGYGCSCCLQPVASAAHFFARVPALPYLMGTDCPGECNYALGHYRPGSCVPWRRNCVPLNGRGGLSQAGAVMGLVFLLP